MISAVTQGVCPCLRIPGYPCTGVVVFVLGVMCGNCAALRAGRLTCLTAVPTSFSSVATPPDSSAPLSVIPTLANVSKHSLDISRVRQTTSLQALIMRGRLGRKWRHEPGRRCVDLTDHRFIFYLKS